MAGVSWGKTDSTGAAIGRYLRWESTTVTALNVVDILFDIVFRLFKPYREGARITQPKAPYIQIHQFLPLCHIILLVLNLI